MKLSTKMTFYDVGVVEGYEGWPGSVGLADAELFHKMDKQRILLYSTESYIQTVC